MDYSYAAVIYKIVSLLVGLAFAYMGYRLFMSSVWGHAGELDAQFGKNRILLKKAAPGTFFVLFGALVVALTIWKGMILEKQIKGGQPDNGQLSLQYDPTPPESPQNGKNLNQYDLTPPNNPTNEGNSK